MRFITLLAALLLLFAAPLVAQTVTVPGPTVSAAWNANPEPDIAGYHLIIDSTIYDVGNVTQYTVATVDPGNHVAALTATNQAGQTSPPSAPVDFAVQPAPDPCKDPLSGHMPAIFPTAVSLTNGGKAGTRSFLNYQEGGQDRVVELAVQVDGADDSVARATGPTDDLHGFSGRWFTQPAPGNHMLGLRIVTSFGCRLTVNAAQLLVVKP